MRHAVQRIVSGGQTGVDQAALQLALDLGIPHGGWCPAGRLSESGEIPCRYELRESHSARYSVRTEQNVIDSDATLILYRGKLTGGTALTRRLAKRRHRPWLSLDLCSVESAGLPLVGSDEEAGWGGCSVTELAAVCRVWRWLASNEVGVLNVAGPRESSAPGVYRDAYRFLQDVFRK